MSRKTTILIAMVICSFIGSYVATLLGAGTISFGSLLGSALGSLAGIYIGFKLSS